MNRIDLGQSTNWADLFFLRSSSCRQTGGGGRPGAAGAGGEGGVRGAGAGGG